MTCHGLIVQLWNVNHAQNLLGLLSITLLGPFPLPSLDPRPTRAKLALAKIKIRALVEGLTPNGDQQSSKRREKVSHQHCCCKFSIVAYSFGKTIRNLLMYMQS